MNSCRGGLLAIVIALSLCGPVSAAENPWFLSLYGGKSTLDSAHEIAAFDVAFEDSKILVLAGGKHLVTYRNLLRLEAEGQLAKHWGLQDHVEVNALVTFRWLPFPWDAYLDTSFAVGEGLSYATEDPEIEIEKHGKTSKLLNYLLFELEVALPGAEQWSLFTRIHHRSGAFGLFDGVSGGSDAVGVGLRWTF